MCVAGRLSEEQATAIEHYDWNKLNEDGRIVMEDDRVIYRECSKLLRELEGRD
jgi:hypothetical protein